MCLNDDRSHETERRLLLGRKAMTNLDGVLKSRDITLPTKVCPEFQFHMPIFLIDSSTGCPTSSPNTTTHLRMEKEMATHSSILA